jgi:exonuclease SbcC
MNFDNTFGYGEDNCIDFRKLNGVVGLFGRNRAGKSSIPGTIMYGLYNTNDRGISSLLHVVNTRKPHASADITFTVDGKLYRLERQTVRHKVKNRAETTITHLNLYEVDSDDKIIRDLSGEQRRETEETLRNLIGNPEEFMMTSFAPQGNMNSFIQRGSTERKRILSNFLGLEIFDLLHARVKEEGAGIKSMLKRLQVKDWVTEIRSSKQKIKTLEEQTNVLKRSLTSEKEKYSELKSIAQKEHNDDFIDPDLIKSLERKIKTKMATLENTQTEILSYEEKIISLNTRLEKYELIKNQFPIESLKRRQNTLDSLKLNLSKIDSKLKAEKSILKSQQKSVKLLNEVPCGDKFPSCKFIKESHKNKILVEKQNQIVADLTENVLSLKANVLDLEKEGLHNKIERYTAMLKKEAEDKLKTVKFESTIAEKTRDMSLLEKETEKLQKNLLELKLRNKTEFNDELTQLEKKLSKISKIISEIEDKIVRTAEKIGHSRSNISQLQKDQIEYDKLQVEWKVYDFLIKATSWRGIPTYIMRKQIPVINKELSSILQDATGFTIEFEINERNMNVFLNYGDSRRPIECASGMEKMISSLAIRVALSNISNLNKPDMLIVDEGFGTLDPQNIEVVTSLLHRLKSFYKQIIIISHVEVIKDSVDDMIEITKRGVDSRVRYE